MQTTASAGKNIITGQITESEHYRRFGGLCAILAGVTGLAYAVSFGIIDRISPSLSDILSPIFLLLGGLLSIATLTAVYRLLYEVDPGFSLLALLLTVIGAAGAIMHGGYNLANAINPPATTNTDLPSAVDPRGFLTFGVTGLALFLFSWLIMRHPKFPAGLAYLGYGLAALLVIIYLARLIILSTTSLAIVIPVVLTGFIINPAWYIWLGITLRKRERFNNR